jgi:outer membrane protein, heavy metal efflux system
MADDAPPTTPGVLTEEQAINLALTRNAAFAEQLTELGFTRADVIQAGLLPNPDLTLLLPVGPKQTEGTLSFPLEFLWLRDKRIAAARSLSDRAAARLTQLGLDLIRDVRLAYADLALARERLALLKEAADLRQRIAAIAEARVRNGDASPLDAASARVDALRANEEAARVTHDVSIAEERLRSLLGLGSMRKPLTTTPPAPMHPGPLDIETLVNRAIADRPDALAAALAVDAARERAKLARTDYILFSALIDANERGTKGFEAGPGLKATIPIFNQNQGAIARADAELERATRQQATLKDRIILEVREAHEKALQAEENLQTLHSQIRPALEEAVTLAERSYQAGQAPLVQVLDASRQLLDARIREAQVASDLRRARAELERSVGRRLDTLKPPSTRPTTAPATAPTVSEK